MKMQKSNSLKPQLKVADKFLDPDAFKTDMVLKELDELIVMRELPIEDQVKRMLKR